MKAVPLTAVLIALIPSIVSAEKLGDHPAIVVQRLQAGAGYDYASKFYPHPAWLYLSVEAPRSAPEEPEQSIAGSPSLQAPAGTSTKPSDAASASAMHAVSARPAEARK
jgi:hypothetical protein